VRTHRPPGARDECKGYSACGASYTRTRRGARLAAMRTEIGSPHRSFDSSATHSTSGHEVDSGGSRGPEVLSDEDAAQGSLSE
jgi:hypothetical protein